jgi:hypothetical protein
MESEEKINPIRLQLEQVKLANQTAQVIMRDCPTHMLDSLKAHFETYIFSLQVQSSHIDTCEYTEAKRECSCGFVHSESMRVSYIPKIQRNQ